MTIANRTGSTIVFDSCPSLDELVDEQERGGGYEEEDEEEGGGGCCCSSTIGLIKNSNLCNKIVLS